MMSEWVDIAVYAALIVAVWGLLPAWSSRLAIPVIEDRNPEWLADHPALERHLRESRWFRWSCLIWGAVSLLTIVAFQAGAWPRQLAFLRTAPRWEAIKDLNSLLFIAGLIYAAVCALLFVRWLGAHVPLSSRRRATLERRSLHHYVPVPVQGVVGAAVVLHLASWVVVGVSGGYATSAFWGGLAFQFAIAGVYLLVVVVSVRRRPAAMDRIFGPRYRQAEVRAAFGAQLLPFPNGIARLYEHAGGASPEQVDRFMHLALVLLVVTVVTILVAWSRRPPSTGSAHPFWLGPISRRPAER